MKYYTTKEVAEMFRVSTKTILNMLDGKQLRGVKVSKVWRISDADIDEYISRNQIKEGE